MIEALLKDIIMDKDMAQKILEQRLTDSIQEDILTLTKQLCLAIWASYGNTYYYPSSFDEKRASIESIEWHPENIGHMVNQLADPTNKAIFADMVYSFGVIRKREYAVRYLQAWVAVHLIPNLMAEFEEMERLESI